MKRILTLLLASFLTATTFAADFNFGLTFSPNFNWFRVDEVTSENDGLRMGMSYGLLIDYNLGDNFAISSGFLHNLNGGKVAYTRHMEGDTSLPSFAVKDLYKVQHIELPISLKLKTNQIGYITYYGQFGVMSAFRVRARADRVSENTNFAENFENKDVRSPDDDVLIKGINFFNLSLHVGAGINYSLSGSTSLLAGIYYNNGFVNFVREKDSEENITQNRIGVRLGIMF
ncbi:MAG: PorT family protein [Chitinophagaceae bacterium]|nr:MAG: PorT family protein [Chitinophagaceae bacterium]